MLAGGTNCPIRPPAPLLPSALLPSRSAEGQGPGVAAGATITPVCAAPQRAQPGRVLHGGYLGQPTHDTAGKHKMGRWHLGHNSGHWGGRAGGVGLRFLTLVLPFRSSSEWSRRCSMNWLTPSSDSQLRCCCHLRKVPRAVLVARNSLPWCSLIRGWYRWRPSLPPGPSRPQTTSLNSLWPAHLCTAFWALQ